MKKANDWYVPNHMAHAGNHLRRSAVIDIALKYLEPGRRHTVLQAGGHIGIWPKLLSKRFQQVYTWEPIPENWECLVKNIEGIDNIMAYHQCIGEKVEDVKLQYSKKNTGKHCIHTRGTIPSRTMTLDSLGLRTVDAIFLDVEGWELATLLGAHVTIHNCRPLIVAEENGLQSRYGIDDAALGKHLSTYGYEKKEGFEEDIIYALREDHYD